MLAESLTHFLSRATHLIRPIIFGRPDNLLGLHLKLTVSKLPVRKAQLGNPPSIGAQELRYRCDRLGLALPANLEAFIERHDHRDRAQLRLV
jgi:hypothetical protein